MSINFEHPLPTADLERLERSVPTVDVSGSGNVLAAHQGRVVRASGTITLTLQPQATVSTDANAVVIIRNVGAGVVTLAIGAGVTVAPAGGGTIPANGEVKLHRVTGDTWDRAGVLS